MEGPPDEDMTEWVLQLHRELPASPCGQPQGHLVGASETDQGDWPISDVPPGSPQPGGLHAWNHSTGVSSLDPSNPTAKRPAAAGDAPGSLGSRDGGCPFAAMLGVMTSSCGGGIQASAVPAAAGAGAGGAVEDLSRAPSTDSGSAGLALGHLSLGSPHAAVFHHPSSQPALGSMPPASQQQLVPAQGMFLSAGAVPPPALQPVGLGPMPGSANLGSPSLNPQLAGILEAMSAEEQAQLLQHLLQARSQQQMPPGVDLGMATATGSQPVQLATTAGPGMPGAAAAPGLLGADIMAAAAAAAPPPPPPPTFPAAAAGGRCILLPADLGSLAAQLEAQLLQLQPGTEQRLTAAKDVQIAYADVGGVLQQVSGQEAAVSCLVGLQQWQMAEAASQGWQPPRGVLAAASSYHDLLRGITPRAIDWAPKEAPEQPKLWWVPSSNGRRDPNRYAPRNCSYTSHTARIIKGDEARNICRVVGQVRVLDPQQQQVAQDTVLYLVPVQVDGGLEGFLLGLRVDNSGKPLQAGASDLERYPYLHCVPLPFSEHDNDWDSFFRGPSSSVWRYGRVMGLLDIRQG